MAREKALQPKTETPEVEAPKRSIGPVKVRFKKTMATSQGIFKAEKILEVNADLARELAAAGIVEVL